MRAPDSPRRVQLRPPRTPWPRRHHVRSGRGSLDRPINTPLVRATALLLVGPLLLLALSIGRPGPFPDAQLPNAFDGPSAAALATELARDYPDRAPGSAGATGAAAWYRETLRLYALATAPDVWDQTIPGLGRVQLRNLVTVIPGLRKDAILFVAHRDNRGVGPGANNNASGTAALIELVRAYGRLGTIAGRPQPQHTLIFLSSDGGAYGGYGAERFASTSPLRERVKAAIALEGLAGKARPRLEIAGFGTRSPAPALTRTVDVQVAAQMGESPARPDWLVQLTALGLPFGYGEQAPFLSRQISAVRLTTAAENGSDAAGDVPAALDAAVLAKLGRAAESVLASLDGGIELAGGTAANVYLGDRVVRGWAIEFVFLVALVPFLVGSIDLFARMWRRGLLLAGAWRALRVRFGFWLWVGLLVWVGALTGIFPRDSVLPPAPDSPMVTDLPVAGLIALGAVAALGWLRARRPLTPTEPAEEDDVLAGYAVTLLALGGVAIATALISPYGLAFVIPSLYAWLWLPQMERTGWARDALYGVGLLGPVLATVAIGTSLGLGFDTPYYLVSLMTLGFIPWTTVLVLITWTAIASQLGALAAGRYRPVARRTTSPRRLG